MNRCVATTQTFISTLLLAAAALVSLPAPAQQVLQQQPEAAVGGRQFPPTALRGDMTFLAPPFVQLDGKEQRLSPGARVQTAQRMFVTPGQLAGQRFAVNYTVEQSSGMVRDVWLLTPQEAAVKRAGATKPFLNFWPFVSSGS